MVTYTVHEPPNPPADRVDRADALQFVKDGFTWTTAVFPPIGFIGARLWLPLIAYFAVLSGIAAGLNQIGVNAAWTTLIATALNVYLGFELSSLQRWSLDRAGWSTLGAVTGHDLGECERRFLESWLPSQPAVVTARHAASATSGQKFGGLWPFAAKG